MLLGLNIDFIGIQPKKFDGVVEFYKNYFGGVRKGKHDQVTAVFGILNTILISIYSANTISLISRV